MINTTELSTADWMFINDNNHTTPTPHEKAPDVLFKALQWVIILVILVGLPGNLLTILSVCHYRRLRTAGNAFVTCMSIVDSLYYGFMLPVRFATFHYGDQFFSDQFCIFLGSFSHFVQGISVMSLSAISLNRLLFIRQHKHYQKIYSRGALIFQIVFMWVFAFFFTICLPCSGLWGDFSFQAHVLSCTFTPGSHPGYKITVVTMGFWVPTTFIVVCYSMIYVHFMSSHNKMNTWTNEQKKITSIQPEPPVATSVAILNKPKNTLTKIQEEEQTNQLRNYMNKKVKPYRQESGVFSNGLSNTSYITSEHSKAKGHEQQEQNNSSWTSRQEERRGSNFSGNSEQYLLPESSSPDSLTSQNLDKGKSGGSDDKPSNNSDLVNRRSSEVLSKSGVCVNINSPGNYTNERHFSIPTRLMVKECSRQESISSIPEMLHSEEESNEGETDSTNTEKNTSCLQEQSRESSIFRNTDLSGWHLAPNLAENTTKGKYIDNVFTGPSNFTENSERNIGQNTSVIAKTSDGGSTIEHRKTTKDPAGSPSTPNERVKSVNGTALDHNNAHCKLSASELLHLRTEVLIQKRKQLAHKEHHQNMQQTIANKRRKEAIRMTLMMLCIFCLFVICILPYFLVNIINSEIENASAYLIALMCTWFNGCVNPVVYAMMNAQFRSAYKSLLSRCRPNNGSRDKVKDHQNSDKMRLHLHQSASHI